MTNKLFSLICTLFPLFLSAQNDSLLIDSVLFDSAIFADTFEIDTSFTSDSATTPWITHVPAELIEPLPAIEITDSIIPEFPDSIYIKRLYSINSLIPLSYNPIVRNFIHVYTDKKRDKLESILGLKDYYFPFFESVLAQYGLPLELKYLPVIESALHPRAYSHAGAAGLWQFIYSTGRMYNLTINSFVDERYDVIKASHAACRFLNDLYAIYNDWILVIAAYNCGPANVNKAIRRAGGIKNYWKIYYYLPRETRGYVPAFIAAMYAVNFHHEHNIKALPASMPVETDTIMICDNLHFKQISIVLDYPIEKIRLLNPQYKIDIIPGLKAPDYLRLPIEYIGPFIDLQDSIFNFKDSVFFKNNDFLINPANYANSRHSHIISKDQAKVYHIVKSGESLGIIAQRYRVRISDIKYWNHIRSNTIRTGQKLILYIPKNRLKNYSGSKTTQPSSSLNGEFVYYIVKKGDTLSAIAAKFGVAEKQIILLNKLSNADKLMYGQKLKIKRK